MNKLSPGVYFRQLKRIHATFVFLQVLIILIILFVRNNLIAEAPTIDIEFLGYVVPFFAAVGLYEGNRHYKRKLRYAQDHSTLARKLIVLRRAVIVRYALWEAPSLLSIAAYFLTSEWIYLALSGLIIIVFLIYKPDLDRIRQELDL